MIPASNSLLFMASRTQIPQGSRRSTLSSHESTDVRAGWYGVVAAALVVPTIGLGVYWGPVYDFVARSLAMAQ